MTTRRAPAHLLTCALLLAGAARALETGTVQTGISTFAASFAGAYRDPVVIAGIPSHNGAEEIVVRITNVNAATKTIQFYADPPSTEGEGDACQATFHATETFSWLIAESTAAGAAPDALLQAGTVMGPSDPLLTIGRYANPDSWVE